MINKHGITMSADISDPKKRVINRLTSLMEQVIKTDPPADICRGVPADHRVDRRESTRHDLRPYFNGREYTLSINEFMEVLPLCGHFRLLMLVPIDGQEQQDHCRTQCCVKQQLHAIESTASRSHTYSILTCTKRLFPWSFSCPRTGTFQQKWW